MAELGIATSNDSIAAHYADTIDAMLHDARDAPPGDIPARAMDTLMQSLDDRVRVAREAVLFANSLK
jgi:LPPG:FO 2-phospho-L-lactate transferase